MVDTDAFSEAQILAMTIDGEAANQSLFAQRGVAATVMRRVALRWQGETTVRGVCLHPEQYDCWTPGDDRRRIIVNAGWGFLALALDAIQGFMPDPTGGATHYYDKSISPPYWTQGRNPTASIDSLVFYDLSRPLAKTVPAKQ